MHHANIFQTAKNPMQSGTAKSGRWKLEFIPQTGYFVEGLMGWTGMDDMTRELHLFFATQEEAEAYAKHQGITYEVIQPKKRQRVIKSYADNFKYQANS